MLPLEPVCDCRTESNVRACGDGALSGWQASPVIAEHWHPADSAGRVECDLCPRHCRPRDGQHGFCRVRGNVDGRLHTLNYGKSVAPTEEVIETEAVYHYSPGHRILSLGNIGCMMACDFCQNWQTSQVRHLDSDVVKSYTPNEVVEICEDHDLGMISWTYNDPVVWHEFVLDTSRLARKKGLRTLYKSALYIEEAPARELIDCIDVFSISLKSMSEDFYRKITKGELGPVLERIKMIHRSGRHLEISQLVIPERNDGLGDIHQTVQWVLDNLGDQVPLHFVGFHPAYRYTDVERTSVECLLQARDEALRAGIKHCYLGNVYQEGVSDTHCSQCGHTLVTRYGLTASVVGIAPGGTCSRCGQSTPIRFPFGAQPAAAGRPQQAAATSHSANFRWTGDVNSVHLTLARQPGDGPIEPLTVMVQHVGTPRVQHFRIGDGLERVIVSKGDDRDREILITWDGDREVRVFPVLDRAHFPIEPEELLLEETRPLLSTPMIV